MSIDRCCKCSRQVDTDFDTDCYQPDPRHSLAGHPDICICEPCREEEIDQFMRDVAEARAEAATDYPQEEHHEHAC